MTGDEVILLMRSHGPGAGQPHSCTPDCGSAAPPPALLMPRPQHSVIPGQESGVTAPTDLLQ